jgi:two-component system, NarL family, sensor histidine kinase DesK
MKLSTLLQNIRHPPADSMVGHMSAQDGGRALRHMPFVMMIHIVWLFLWPVLAGASFLTVLLPTLLTVPVFMWLYLSMYYYSGPNAVRLRYAAGIFLLGFALAKVNLSSMAYFIFAFFSIVYLVPTRQAGLIVGGVNIAFIAEMILFGHGTQTIVGVAVPSIIMGLVAIYTSRIHMAQVALRKSNAEITRLATLAERERIGRDLHDSLGHILSVVALKSELARKLIDRDLDAARTEIAEVERVARDALSQVRSAISGIRNTALSSELVAATALLEAQGVKVKCETENVNLPHDRETVLALSLREATTNIRRHSGATGVTIRVKKDSAAVLVEVVDDGRGGRIVPGNGLNGMRERLESVGGSLLLIPNETGGTLLRATVPLAA